MKDKIPFLRGLLQRLHIVHRDAPLNPKYDEDSDVRTALVNQVGEVGSSIAAADSRKSVSKKPASLETVAYQELADEFVKLGHPAAISLHELVKTQGINPSFPYTPGRGTYASIPPISLSRDRWRWWRTVVAITKLVPRLIAIIAKMRINPSEAITLGTVFLADLLTIVFHSSDFASSDVDATVNLGVSIRQVMTDDDAPATVVSLITPSVDIRLVNATRSS